MAQPSGACGYDSYAGNSKKCLNFALTSVLAIYIIKVQMATKSEILSLNAKRESIVRELLALFPIIPGAFKEVFRKCGKPNCWCAQHTEGHSLRRITWSENSNSKSKAVAPEDIDWYIIATENYRAFKKLLKTMRQIDESIIELLTEYSMGQAKLSRNDMERAKANAKT
jgi:hypothetical protein